VELLLEALDHFAYTVFQLKGDCLTRLGRSIDSIKGQSIIKGLTSDSCKKLPVASEIFVQLLGCFRGIARRLLVDMLLGQPSGKCIKVIQYSANWSRGFSIPFHK
jgi:hypothetical protein